MSKYKLGDRLVYSGPENEHGFYTVGKIYTITRVFEEDNDYQMTDNYSRSHWWNDEGIDKNFNVVKSPVVEKTVKSIEPGYYGAIEVSYYEKGSKYVYLKLTGSDNFGVGHEFTADKLESVIKVLSELVIYLREKE